MRHLPMVVFALVAGCSSRSEPTRTEVAPTGAESRVESATEAPEQAGVEPSEMSRVCQGESISVGGGANVLDEARAEGVEAPDFLDSYAAAAIEPSSGKAMAVTASYRVDGKALLWIADDAVVVDQAVFPEGLRTAELTTMNKGTRASLGRIEPAALEQLGLPALTEFLLHARVIGAWIHIGAQLCPVEVTEEDGQAAAYAGTHTYFTNEENVDDIAFILRVSPAGALEIEAR